MRRDTRNRWTSAFHTTAARCHVRIVHTFQQRVGGRWCFGVVTGDQLGKGQYCPQELLPFCGIRYKEAIASPCMHSRSMACKVFYEALTPIKNCFSWLCLSYFWHVKPTCRKGFLPWWVLVLKSNPSSPITTQPYQCQDKSQGSLIHGDEQWCTT